MASIQGRALAELEERYEIRNGREVLRYLAEYPDLEAVLMEAYMQISQLFGEDATARLEFWQNPEEESDNCLSVTISSQLNGDEAYKKLDLLDKWAIDIMPRHYGYIGFDIGR